MKTCPRCGSRMDDAQSRCGACGADYLEAVVGSITSGVRTDEETLLQNLEAGLDPLKDVPLPTTGETLRRQLPALSGAAGVFFLAAAFATGANILLLAGAAALVLFAALLVARLRGRRPASRAERIVRAVRRIFEEDAAALRKRIGDQPQTDERIGTMQRRIDEAEERLAKAHASNRRKILAAALTVGALAAIGCGALAVRNQAACKAAEEYALRPGWMKLRDSYLSSPDNDEYGSPSTRTEVVRAMLDAGVTSEAETFFFDRCQGSVGDADCARMIALHYRNGGERDALEAFLGRIALRYDSDTRKIRSLKL